MGRTSILMSAVLLILLASRGLTEAGEAVRITNGEWPPFTSARIDHNGVLSRIVREAFALKGITVEYGYFPWKRAYSYAKQGQWDGSVGWAPTIDHLQDFYMSEPVVFVDKALFHLKRTPFDWKTIDDLRRWRVGATAGYAYGVEWDQAVKAGRLQVSEVSLDEQNIKKLLMDRIDVIAMEIDVAFYLMETQLTAEEAARITYHPRLLMRTPICLALSRRSEKSPGLIGRFNEGLLLLKQSGRYDQYIEESRRGDYLRRPSNDR